jgi:hypothetical protein
MNQLIEPPSSLNPANRLGPPPLRVHHFLIWMTITALLLAVVRSLLDWWNRSYLDDVVRFDSRWAVGTVILAGYATIAVLVLFWLRWTHWLAVGLYLVQIVFDQVSGFFLETPV